METLTLHVSEISNQAMLMYRTMVIKAELKRRKALTNAQVDGGHILPTADAATTPTCASMCNRDRSEMKRVFDLFDTNKDGLISVEELQQYMQKLGSHLSEQTARGIVGSVDRNSDEFVDFEEFYSLYGSLSDNKKEKSFSEHFSVGNSENRDDATEEEEEEEEEEEALIKAFFNFDENRDGVITPAELHHVLLKLGIPEGRSLDGCQKMIEKVDVDGNGKVDFFEFKQMMCSNDYTYGCS
ncbi:unnamed protein product [Calypogeia fissa]